MKQNSIIVLISFIVLSACSKEEAVFNSPLTMPPVTTNTGTQFDTTGTTTLASGTFVSAVHTTSGKATWYKQGAKQYLYLTNFITDAGPDLKVYLSKDRNSGAFINIGDLKSNTGNQVYEFTGNFNPSDYPYVLIWCQRFSVLFGSAYIQ